MKVLFLESSVLYEDLLPAGLRQAGCEVRTVREVWGGALDRALLDFRPDFVLMMGWSDFPTAERLALIRAALDRHGTPLVFWSTEDPCWHEEWSVPVVHAVSPDLVVTICAEYVARYRAMGFEAACLPFGYNHMIYRPVAPRPEYACDIAVVANFYTAEFDRLNRKRSLHALLNPLFGQGYDLRIWGAHWEQASRFGVHVPEGALQSYLYHREVPAVYRSAKIVIGPQNEFAFETNLTMRTCEIMGSGGFLLTSRTKAVEGMFVHGQHLVMSASPEETLDLVAYYLGRPEERAAIAAAGERLVRSSHTYEHRARALVELVSMLTDWRRGHRHFGPMCLPPGPYTPRDESDGSGNESLSDSSGSESESKSMSGISGTVSESSADSDSSSSESDSDSDSSSSESESDSDCQKHQKRERERLRKQQKQARERLRKQQKQATERLSKQLKQERERLSKEQKRERERLRLRQKRQRHGSEWCK